MLGCVRHVERRPPRLAALARFTPGIAMTLFPLSLVLACTATSSTEDSAGADTASSTSAGVHPIAPDEYESDWDLESTGCDDVVIHWAFDGSVDADGRLEGKESWYWFFAAEGWDGDCVDTFTVTAIEEPTPIENDACNSCDRDFTATYEMSGDDRTCAIDGYESLLDNDDTDRIEEEIYTFALMFDTDPLGGEPGDLNVWSYVQDDRSDNEWIDRTTSLGGFAPSEGDDYDGPGDVTWSLDDGFCVTMIEE